MSENQLPLNNSSAGLLLKSTASNPLCSLTPIYGIRYSHHHLRLSLLTCSAVHILVTAELQSPCHCKAPLPASSPHCGFAATELCAALPLLSPGSIWVAGRKLPLTHRIPYLFPISWSSASNAASCYLLLSKQKFWGNETAFSFTKGNRSPFHCTRNLALFSTSADVVLLV